MSASTWRPSPLSALALVTLTLAWSCSQRAAAARIPLRTGAATISTAAFSAAATPEALATFPNYSLNNSKDTFEICKLESGLKREIPLEDLLPVYGLPKDLHKRPPLTLSALIELLEEVAPNSPVVFAPMLSGDADVSGVLAGGRLPRLVHFTVKDKNRLAPHQVVSMASWARLNPGYSLMLFDDADIRSFMTTYYPELLPTFDGLDSQVERTDMWRYLVICIFGGVYADSDVVCAKPIDQWAQDAGLLVGIENVFKTMEAAKKRDYTRQVQMVQWVIAARRGHPAVCRMGNYVAAHVAKERSGELVHEDRDHAILERTGPGIWSSSVHDYIAEHHVAVESLVGGGRVGDARLLPQSVFGCSSATFQAQDRVPYVYHMFKGSWRTEKPGKLWQLAHMLRGLLSKDSSKEKGSSKPKAGQQQQQQRAPAPAPAVGLQSPGEPQQQQRQQHQQQQRALESRKLRAAGGMAGATVVSSGVPPLLTADHVFSPDIGVAGLLPVLSLVVVACVACSALLQSGQGTRLRSALAGRSSVVMAAAAPLAAAKAAAAQQQQLPQQQAPLPRRHQRSSSLGAYSSSLGGLSTSGAPLAAVKPLAAHQHSSLRPPCQVPSQEQRQLQQLLQQQQQQQQALVGAAANVGASLGLPVLKRSWGSAQNLQQT